MCAVLAGTSIQPPLHEISHEHTIHTQEARTPIWLVQIIPYQGGRRGYIDGSHKPALFRRDDNAPALFHLLISRNEVVNIALHIANMLVTLGVRDHAAEDRAESHRISGLLREIGISFHGCLL